MKRYAICIVMLFVLANNALANVQANIDSGLSWLLSHQNADSSFGSQSELIFRDTQETLQTLNLLSQKGIQFQNALQWSVNTKVGSIDFIARKIILLSNAGSDTTEGVNLLLSNQNTDGGWGLAQGQESDCLDTGFALVALKTAHYSDQTITQFGLNYLLSTQNADGGWGFYQGNDSNVYMTALVSFTLQQFTQSTTLATAGTKATSYLKAHQNMDGGFGTSSSTAYETALAYEALVNVITDATVLGNAVNYLTMTQSSDGSWIQDPYSTALALKALHISESRQMPPSVVTGTVMGTIVDATTNQPLQGVSVSLASDPQIQTSTNAMGNFTLSNISQGSQSILLSLAGYATVLKTSIVGAGSIIDLGTMPMSSISTKGMIKGTVTDAANGQPLSGVTISITGSSTGNTVTGLDGSFTISDVTPGAVIIAASITNYYDVTGSGTVAAGDVLQFNPQMSTTPAAGTAGNLRGKVFDSATNKPIQGTTISISGNASVSSDLLGVFNVANITPGAYNVTISATGYASQNYQIIIIAGVTMDIQIIYLTPTSQTTTVKGRITDALSGAPIVNASLEVTGSSLSARTDSMGAYTITGINNLKFNLITAAIGYDSFTFSVTTTGPGTYNINLALHPSKVSDVRLASLSAETFNYSAAAPVKFLMNITNAGYTDVQGTMLLEIISPEGSTIYTDLIVNTGANQIDTTSNSFDFIVGGSAFETYWMTGQRAPGQYSVVVTLLDLNNLLLDKKSTSFTIMSGKILSGNIYLDPFVAQANQPVNVKAKIRNAGNVFIDNADLTLSVTIQGETTPLWVITKPLTDFPVGAEASIDYGSFIPEKGGIYNLQVTPDQTDIFSSLKTTISVGPYVMGTFSISPDKVGSGSQTIKGDIHLIADTQGLYPAVGPMEHNKVKILLDEAHAAAIRVNSEFAKIIGDDGFQLFATTLPLSQEILTDMNVLVLPGTSYLGLGINTYSASEIDAIYNFVINGGGLFVIADHTVYGIPFQPIIQRFGASFAGNNIGENLHITQDQILQHDITNGMQAMYQWDSSGCNSFSQLPSGAQILATYGDYNILAAIPEGGAAGKGRIVISTDINSLLFGNSASIIDQNPTDWLDIAVKGNSLFTRNVIRWLAPRALTGINTTANLVLPYNITLSSPRPLPKSITQLQNDQVRYAWEISNVGTMGTDINFNLSFNNLNYGDVYHAAKDAYISFVNRDTNNLVTVPITIPTLNVDSLLNISAFTDKTTYTANENVKITTTITNNGSLVQSVTAHLIIEDSAGSQVGEVAIFPIDKLEPAGMPGWSYRITAQVSANWGLNDSLAGVEFDFAQALLNLGQQYKVLDKNSVRVLEQDAAGNIVGEKQAQAVFRSDTFAYITWLLDGITANETTRFFSIYFDIIENGSKTASSNTKLPKTGKIIAFTDDAGVIYTAINNGDGTFGEENIVDTIANTGQTRGVVLDDFNGDGYVDIIVGSAIDGKIYFYKNNADRTNTFSPKIQIGVVSAPGFDLSIVAGDFNNDGYKDFVASGDKAVDLALFLGKGDGTFKRTPIPPPSASGYRGKAAADFNNDGKLDFVVAAFRYFYGSDLCLYLNNGDGTFMAPLKIGYNINELYGVAAGDFDEDGIIDIIAYGFADPSFFKGNNDGTFRTPISIVSLYTLSNAALAVGDFDNDGHLDIVAANEREKTITYYPGNGNGTFGILSSVAWTQNPTLGISSSPALSELQPILGYPQAVVPQSFNFTWNTGNTFAGPYSVHVTLSESSGIILESIAPFEILPDVIAPDTSIRAKVNVDKVSYKSNETAGITSVVTSQSANYLFENLSAKLTIAGSGGQGTGDSGIYTETKPITTLMPGAAYTFKSYWNTSTHAAGTYPVTLEVKDASGAIVATGTQNLVISNVIEPKAVLKGQISVDLQSVLTGEPVIVSYNVTNIGNVDLPNVGLSALIVHVANQTVYATLTSQASITMGGSFIGSGQIDTQTYSAMDYLVILQASINGTTETLAGSYFRVEGAPSAPSLSLPANGSDVETGTPQLVVNNASDPNDDKLTYEFEVYGDAGLTNQVTGDRVQGTGWTVPLALTENVTYYWRCRAFDGKLYGDWMSPAAFRVNTVNDPPTAPTVSGPENNTAVAVLSPMLIVNNASDPDSGSLTYNFELSLDPDFTQIIASTIGVISGPSTSSGGTTSWQTPVSLTENTWYFWRAQADDWLTTGPWSTTAGFFVNTTNQAPANPVIIAPSNNAEVASLSPDITLANSTDPDSSTLTYFFELDTVPTFDSPGIVQSNGISEGQVTPAFAGAGSTSWQATGLQDNTRYYVRAKANDGQADSSWSGVINFFVNTANDPPISPTLANPSDGAGVNVFTPILSVHNSTDPDNDVLTYEFEVYGDTALTNQVAGDRGQGTGDRGQGTGWTVPITLTENATYYWRCRAFDGEAYSPWMPQASFMVNTANDAPGAPQLSSPADGSSVATLTPVLEIRNAVDPDSDALTYDFEVYSDSGLAQLVASGSGVQGPGAGLTSWTVTTALADNTAYQWRVRASDGDRYGAWMAMAAFTTHLPQTGISATINFDPDTLNQKSNGNWVTVYIELPAGHKVTDILVSSIRLEGSVPAELQPAAVGDQDKDKIADLMVKFDRAAVINLLPNGEKVTVRVTGKVGTVTFEGVDIIRVMK